MLEIGSNFCWGRSFWPPCKSSLLSFTGLGLASGPEVSWSRLEGAGPEWFITIMITQQAIRTTQRLFTKSLLNCHVIFDKGCTGQLATSTTFTYPFSFSLHEKYIALVPYIFALFFVALSLTFLCPIIIAQIQVNSLFRNTFHQAKSTKLFHPLVGMLCS